MAVLLTLLLCLGGLYGLVQGLEGRLPAASRFILRFHKRMALGLLGLGLYALLHFADDGAWIFLTFALLALGLWTLPPPAPRETRPTARERLATARPWMLRLLFLALPGIAVLNWLEPDAALPLAEKEISAVAEAGRAAPDESLVFYPLGPRQASTTPRTIRPAAPVPAEAVEAPSVFWRLVEKVSFNSREKIAAAPVPATAARKVAHADARRAARSRPPGIAAKTATSAPPVAQSPARPGVNQPVIDAMLARAEMLLRRGRREEAATVARNVLAFDPANPAARRIREAAGAQ